MSPAQRSRCHENRGSGGRCGRCCVHVERLRNLVSRVDRPLVSKSMGEWESWRAFVTPARRRATPSPGHRLPGARCLGSCGSTRRGPRPSPAIGARPFAQMIGYGSGADRRIRAAPHHFCSQEPYSDSYRSAVAASSRIIWESRRAICSRVSAVTISPRAAARITG